MNKNYCFTDIHGMYGLWAQIRDFCDETDKIFFLGDACDRGKDGLKIIKELLLDKRVIYLKGNHEDIFSICGSELIEGRSGNLMWWIGNGGEQTLKDFQKLSYESQLWFLTRLDRLPQTYTFINNKEQTIFLSHAGTSPQFSEQQLRAYGHGHDPYLWDRKHFKYTWPQDEKFKNYFVIHGHTPVPYMAYDWGLEVDVDIDGQWNILTYEEGHKINLDLLSCETNKIALFDLDEMKVARYFYGE